MRTNWVRERLRLGKPAIGCFLGLGSPNVAELMAQAGFDPRESVGLWQNMAAANGGNEPPEFMSTHPSNATRIGGLQARLPEVMPLYNQAKAAGRKPSCG